MDYTIFMQLLEWLVMIELIKSQDGKTIEEIMYEQQNPKTRRHDRKLGIMYNNNCCIKNERCVKRLMRIMPVVWFAGNFTLFLLIFRK